MTADGHVDLLIPRGGAGLIRACVDNATVPVIETGTGICHVYVDGQADQDMALDIVENAKCSPPQRVQRRGGVPGGPGHRAKPFCPGCKPAHRRPGRAGACTPWSCGWTRRLQKIIPGTPAGETDFDTEFLDYILGVKVVTGVGEAMPTSPPTPPDTPRPSSPPTSRPPGPSWPRWTPPPSTGTPPPALPTGGSSAWAARWASPPRSSTPGAPWGCRSCVLISTSFGAPVRSADLLPCRPFPPFSG